jgi:hypothetical protein
MTTDGRIEVLGEFDLDIQIDEPALPAPPARNTAPDTQTFVCSCSACCPTQWCDSRPAEDCSFGCN